MILNNFIVYKHTCPNGKVYIGVTSKNPIKRWGTYGNGYKHNSHFYSAILKYGWDNIKHEILFTDLSDVEAFQKEIELIAQYKTNNPDFGYNSSIGGECGSRGIHFSHSDETKRKMSRAKVGRLPNNCRQIKCIETGELFASISTAARNYKISASNISYVLRGMHETAGGYHWEYVK